MWVMYWHMYVIVAICRESERLEEAVVADGERKRKGEIECKRRREREREEEESDGVRREGVGRTEREFRVVVRASRLAVAAERAMHHGIA